MNPFYCSEKLLYGSATIVTTTLCGIGAIVNDADQRWIYVTLAIGVMCSAFLALVFRKERETMKITVGRCGLSIMGSVFGSPLVVHFYKINGTEDNVLLLAGIAMSVCIASFFIGFAFLRMLDKNSNTFGATLMEMVKLWINKK